MGSEHGHQVIAQLLAADVVTCAEGQSRMYEGGVCAKSVIQPLHPPTAGCEAAQAAVGQALQLLLCRFGRSPADGWRLMVAGRRVGTSSTPPTS